jgi:N-acetylglucosamine-6-phosphate deacetylase
MWSGWPRGYPRAEHKGTLKPGKDADIVILNRDFTVAATILEGEVVYRAEELS